MGEGEYNLNALTAVEITDSYLGLDQDVRKCQNVEPYQNCTSRHYFDTFLGQCGCLPFYMKPPSNKKVHNRECCTSDQLKILFLGALMFFEADELH